MVEQDLACGVNDVPSEDDELMWWDMHRREAYWVAMHRLATSEPAPRPEREHAAWIVHDWENWARRAASPPIADVHRARTIHDALAVYRHIRTRDGSPTAT